MDVRIYATELEFGRGSSISDFFTYLKPVGVKSARTVADSLEKGLALTSDRILIVDDAPGKPDYYAGLLLTIKDAKAFCNLTAQKGKLLLTAQKLEEGSAICDFNFFVICKSTGRGLYQHYHQSTATTSFCRYLKSEYYKYSEEFKEREMRTLRAANPNWKEGKIRSAANKKIAAYLQANVLTRPDAMVELILGLSEIKSLTFEARSVADFAPFGVPSQGMVKRISHKMLFEREPTVKQSCKEFAAKIVAKRSLLKRAKATGLDVDGQEATFKLDKDYQVLMTYDYNEVVADVDLQDLAASVRSAGMVKNLLKLTENKEISAIIAAPKK